MHRSMILDERGGNCHLADTAHRTREIETSPGWKIVLAVPPCPMDGEF